MKKIFLTTMALLTMASASAFGMYGAGSGWIDFLVNGNQFRGRMGQLGFVLGNDTIRGTFGFVANGSENYGQLLKNPNGGLSYNFYPTISMGLGYTSSLISVGVGYNATISTNRWSRYNGKAYGKSTEAVAHTPVLTLTALDNAFRMAIPIQVVHLTDKYTNGVKANITAVSLDAQFRYYTGLEMLPQVRLYLKYGNYSWKAKGEPFNGKSTLAESFGFDFRLYFGSMVEEVALQPILKIQYNTALGRQHNNRNVTAVGLLNDAISNATKIASLTTSSSESISYNGKGGSWNLGIIPSLGLTANSDVVLVYVEPSLGFTINQSGYKSRETYSLAYGVYGEIYVTPIKNLQWYFEAEIGNLNSSVSGIATDTAGTTYDLSGSATSSKYLGFNASTGITWYLPAL